MIHLDCRPGSRRQVAPARYHPLFTSHDGDDPHVPFWSVGGSTSIAPPVPHPFPPPPSPAAHLFMSDCEEGREESLAGMLRLGNVSSPLPRYTSLLPSCVSWPHGPRCVSGSDEIIGILRHPRLRFEMSRKFVKMVPGRSAVTVSLFA